MHKYPRIEYRGPGYRPWVIRYEDGRYRTFEFKCDAEDWLEYENTPFECGLELCVSDADPGL